MLLEAVLASLSSSLCLLVLSLMRIEKENIATKLAVPADRMSGVTDTNVRAVLQGLVIKRGWSSASQLVPGLLGPEIIPA